MQALEVRVIVVNGDLESEVSMRFDGDVERITNATGETITLHADSSVESLLVDAVRGTIAGNGLSTERFAKRLLRVDVA